ncbi:hypothetical protein SAG0170_11225 [Streptococcus agalactiae LDS 617]|uniref:Uncharacterized protein n=1 Tax=Streptococcus agalactiae MRI Z1-216 TaxID=1154879 RepID=A0AAD2WX40_STRAG|nr:hypothetical protein SAG0161_08445 [Streptococcus agalactiae MRI Z1-213]EPU39567.1 hypothetical protein SAG0164_05915 [Streptococcus agalactiae MRI Z1-216]EPU49335.1 hypothetical protein SAG0170_11225 [Streptococcus agalactiae LDS 617]
MLSELEIFLPSYRFFLLFSVIIVVIEILNGDLLKWL